MEAAAAGLQADVGATSGTGGVRGGGKGGRTRQFRASKTMQEDVDMS